jgi:hypothetical protein
MSPDDAQAIRARLTTIAKSSAIGRQIEANIMVESRLPEPGARAMLTGLISEPDEPDALRLRFQELCESNMLTGPPMAGVRPKLLGRAVVLENFCARLVKTGGFRTLKQANSWVKRLCKLSAPELRDRLKLLQLGGRVIWATFREPKRSDHPFLPPPPTAHHLHDTLGLDPKSRGYALLLFVYAPPAGLVLRFPTLADASWGRLFRPAPNDPKVQCGLTAPPTDDIAISPVPEIVHETVTGAVLAAPLQILN